MPVHKKDQPRRRPGAFMIALLLVVAGSASPGIAGDLHPELGSGTIRSTDINGSGATTLEDVAILGCAFLGGPGCPGPTSIPCDCSGGYPQSASDFDCNGSTGLADLAIITTAYLTGVTTTWKCP